jgi:hypothetical protein
MKIFTTDETAGEDAVFVFTNLRKREEESIKINPEADLDRFGVENRVATFILLWQE